MKYITKVWENLEKHEGGLPSGDYLLSKITEGLPQYGIAAVGKGKDSPASGLLIKAVDKKDPRPLWVTVWGGPNILEQALWKVRETRSENEVREFVSNSRSGYPVEIHDYDQPEACFDVPRTRILSDTGTMHIILAVTDHDTPRLTRYQRVIATVTK